MESPHTNSTSPTTPNLGPVKSSNSSTRIVDDVTSLTSFNPFSEEDEHESSYTLVSSLFSRVRNSFAAPLSSAVAAASGSTASNSVANPPLNDSRRVSGGNYHHSQTMSPVLKPASDKLRPKIAGASLAPPLVSTVPALSDVPTIGIEYEPPSNRSGLYASPTGESLESGLLGSAIPGFPIQDDARSIHTTASLKRSASVSKVIRRIRGEGLSKDYWMDDEACRECYNCKSIFTTWRRKHHCRICGQIFCARCASYNIPGYRFNVEGQLRVCNLCFEKHDENEDDDRRSVISSISSAVPPHVRDTYLQSLGHHSQSPFAASQLFGRSDEPFNLYSIAETRRHPSGSDASGFNSRPITPSVEAEVSPWEETADAQPAPFRRAMTDDDKDALAEPEPFPPDQSPTGPRSAVKSSLESPLHLPFPVNGEKSSIQFPGSSPEHGPDSPSMTSRSRVNSHNDSDAQTPFLRSRVQSRLNELAFGEAGWRTRRESTAYAQELNQISMFHLRIMLRQMLTTEGISNIKEWEETLLKLSLRIARDLTFTAFPNREGTDMDVRRYVKIKKIPGGTPKDSEYVDGAVITKNVAHKQMSKSQRNPRVMLVTFPLEFQRVEGQYMHFGQILRQEKEYLGNLASRIAALRPHVVLVENSVSRLALEALVKHNIAVARTVKESAIRSVARMTQGDIFSSIDKLAIEPHLGHCGRFRIQTFDHPLIPSRRKSYMRFEGCGRELGCTIILRGGDMDHLKRVKKVTLFLAFIVRNLKLETHLWKDSVITAPNLSTDAAPQAYLSPALSAPSEVRPLKRELAPDDSVSTREGSTGLSEVESEAIDLSRRIQSSIEPYLKTFISVSATLRFPPPYPIRRMKELDDELQQVRRAWEDEMIRQEEKPSTPKHSQEATVTVTQDSPDTLLMADDIKAQIEALPSPGLLETPTPTSKLAAGMDSPTETLSGDYFSRKPKQSSSFSSLRSPMLSGVIATPSMDRYEDVHFKDESEIATQSALDLVQWQHDEQRRVWEWYLRKNKDDFVVDKYQCISVMCFTLPITELGHHRACFPPQLSYMTFYGKNDCTLGQFIEKSVHNNLVQFLDPKAICEGKACGQPLARHCQVFIHNESRLLVYVEHWDGQIKTRLNAVPTPDLITTWSACRVCGSATPFIPVSEEMQRYSFAKFLELHFYPADVQLVQGAGCIHNIYQHHIRYFAMRGMTVMFQTDPIVLYELVFPPTRIRIRRETLFQLKNRDYAKLLARNAQWYSSLIDDLKLINLDAATGDEDSDSVLTEQINRLIERADTERKEMAKLIQDVYRDTSPIDTLALNRVRAERQDKIVAWEADFDKLPKPKISQLTEKDRKSTFNTVRNMWPRRYDLPGVLENLNFAPLAMSEGEDAPVRPSRRSRDTVTPSDMTSDTSDAELTLKRPSALPSNQRGESQGSFIIRPRLRSGSDSDSTIAAVKNKEPETETGTEDQLATVTSHVNVSDTDTELPPRASRLPRRSGQQPNVADLVKRYQEYLPPTVATHLASSNSQKNQNPFVVESDQDAGPSKHNSRMKMRNRPRLPHRKESTSDFEHSYAASVAPRYLAHRKPSGIPGNRFAGPLTSSMESRDSSRRASPDKRHASQRRTGESGRPSSPPPSKPLATTSNNRPGKVRIASRSTPKEKGQASRIPSLGNVRSTLRKSSHTGFGSKVSNIARQFERIHKDSERITRRYAVIRGRRARPVASSKGATVEVFDSVKDALKDVSDESGESSSEADDEDEDEDDGPLSIKRFERHSSTATARPLPTPESGSMSKDNVVMSSDPEPVSTTQESQSDILQKSPTDPQETEAGATMEPKSAERSGETPLETPSPSDAEGAGPTADRPSTILKALSGFLPHHLRGHLDIEGDDPMADPEHIFRESSMVVRTDEPTSIIALALNSPQYREMLIKSKAEKRNTKEPKLSEDREAFMPDDCSVAETNSTWGVVNVNSTTETNPTEDLRVPSSKLPWAISFESGGLTITCTILYPEQFDALRRTCDCEKSMIESLARCVKWNASGGKSGSAFLKTQDDRFIAKELSRAELESMAAFGPAYFDYMSSAVTAHRPTLLARVFGIYKLTFRKKAEGKSRSKSTQMNLLVMENLFYDKRFTKIFDLKGSTRNRHVQSTGRENEVLLDENLVETAHLNPFYVREHAKRLYRGACFNDTKFLADTNVMDYSLVAGVDSVKNELVLGIVDYIRTYTWDKKLESWVKESTFLATAGKGEPTIVSPKQYRQRFLSAMERYFPLVPDRWMKQNDSPEDEGNALLDLWPDW